VLVAVQVSNLLLLGRLVVKDDLLLARTLRGFVGKNALLATT